MLKTSSRLHRLANNRIPLRFLTPKSTSGVPVPVLPPPVTLEGIMQAIITELSTIIKADLSSLKANDIHHTIALNELLDSFHESDIRRKVMDKQGVEWAQSIKYRCLFDFANQVRDVSGDDPDARKRSALVVQLSRRLHPMLRLYVLRVISFVQEFVASLDESEFPDKACLEAQLQVIVDDRTSSQVISRLIEFFAKGPLKRKDWMHRLQCLRRVGDLVDTDTPSAGQFERM